MKFWVSSGVDGERASSSSDDPRGHLVALDELSYQYTFGEVSQPMWSGGCWSLRMVAIV